LKLGDELKITGGLAHGAVSVDALAALLAFKIAAFAGVGKRVAFPFPFCHKNLSARTSLLSGFQAGPEKEVRS
jgi:hypothetical protein